MKERIVGWVNGNPPNCTTYCVEPTKVHKASSFVDENQLESSYAHKHAAAENQSIWCNLRFQHVYLCAIQTPQEPHVDLPQETQVKTLLALHFQCDHLLSH